VQQSEGEIPAAQGAQVALIHTGRGHVRCAHESSMPLDRSAMVVANQD
jgi:hypothetical protein